MTRAVASHSLLYTPGEEGKGKEGARGRSPRKIENGYVRIEKWHNVGIQECPMAMPTVS